MAAIGRTILGLALGVLIPALVTSIVFLLRRQYDFPFIFLYLPALVFIAYLAGLLPGLTGAVVSTLLADYFFVGPPGLTLQELRLDALPPLLFLVSGIVIAGAGDQYRRYQARLRHDLVISLRRQRHERFVSELMVEFVRPQALPALLDMVAKGCTEVLGEWCSIHLIDPASTKLRLGALHHRDAEKAARLRSVYEEPLDNPLTAQILNSPGPVTVYADDPLVRELMPAVPALREIFTRLRLWGSVWVPIRFRGQILGVLAAGTESPREWDVEDLRLATLLAERTGAAIQNARLDASRTRAEQRVAIQYRVSRALMESADQDEALPKILRIIGEGLGWVWAASWLVDDAAGVLRCNHTWHAAAAVPEIDVASRGRTFEPGVGLPGRIWSGAQPAWIPDVVVDSNFPRAPYAAQDGLHGAFGFPIVIGEKVVGVAEFFSQEVRAPDDTLLHTVAVLGDQIGRFIERRRTQTAVRESEARKTAVLDTAIDCIITMDHQGRIVEFNPAAVRTFGYTLEQAIGNEMAALIIPPAQREAHRQGLNRYLRTGEGPILGRRLEMTAVRADGTEFPVELSVVRIPADGPPIFTGTLRNISERKRAEQIQQFLVEATTELSRSLDYKTALQNVARMAVPRLADWCVVEVIEEDGTSQRVAIVHADPAKVELVREMQRRYPGDPSRPNPLLNALRTGRAEVIEVVTDSLLEGLAHDPQHLDILRRVGPRSYMAVPLVVANRTVGAMTFATAESNRRYGPEDLALAEEVARRAALAVDNARRYEAEQAARREAEREARRTQAINRIVAIASSALDLGTVFDEFAEALQVLLPYIWVTVTFRGPEQDALVTPYVKGPDSRLGTGPLESAREGTAPGWVMETQRAFVRHDTLETREFEEDRGSQASGIRSYMIVPLMVGGDVIGTLNLAHHAPGFYTEEHVRLVQPIADQLAQTISRFRLFDEVQRRAGELSETFQRALLPANLPRVPFVAIEALYQPADPEGHIGGDWYDALQMPNDWVLLSIGDVMGHGVAAAAAMGQVRNFVRAYALEERPPAQILAAANRFLNTLPESAQMSVWIGFLDPFSGELSYAGAGHPPAYVVTDGRADPLSNSGPLLGISPSTEYEEARVVLRPGSRLIAYTDGLIEATRDVVDGERRLKDAVVATANDPTARAAGALIERILEEGKPRDDIAILIVDTLPPDAPLFYTLRALPGNLHRVRKAVRAYAERRGFSGERAEDMVMAVGEAALNVVEHAYDGSPGVLTLGSEQRDDQLTIIVRDFGKWKPPVDRGRGWGKTIMEGFADSQRIFAGATGTVVELSWALGPAAVP